MSVSVYRTRTSRRWLLSKSKDWLAREVLFLMNELGETHTMRTHQPLMDLYDKPALAARYSALCARLPEAKPDP